MRLGQTLVDLQEVITETTELKVSVNRRKSHCPWTKNEGQVKKPASLRSHPTITQGYE